MNIEQQYLTLLNNIIDNGVWKDNRTGIKCKTIANTMLQHDMSNGFPLMTHRQLYMKSTAIELEGFLKGITSKKWYQDRGCKYWDWWANPSQSPYKKDTPFYLQLHNEWQKNNPDLGTIGYSHGWRNFGGSYKPIPFIWTTKHKVIIINDKSKHKLISTVIEGKYGNYTVVDHYKDKYMNSRFEVKFHATGYSTNKVNKKQVLDGNIFDPYFPNICGVAAVGDYKWILNDLNIINKLLNQWRQMIHRCYNKQNKAYNNYGGRGIYVSNRWLVFEYFLQDVLEIEGWENKLKDWRKYQLDKDILGKNYYSKDSCLWVSVSDNTNNTRQNYFFDGIDKNGNEYKNNLGLSRFCKTHNLKIKNVEASITNNSNTHNGWKFIRKNNLSIDQDIVGSDQLKQILFSLKNNPNDRRMVCSAWNPNQMNMAALPSCHVMWGVIHLNGVLNLWWTQRSCDTVLGIPANISSYATLLLLLCKYSGFTPGTLTGYLCDTHIYENHLDGISEILSRTPNALPTLTITHDQPFELIGDSLNVNWTHKDYKLENYNPLGKIPFEVAV